MNRVMCGQVIIFSTVFALVLNSLFDFSHFFVYSKENKKITAINMLSYCSQAEINIKAKEPREQIILALVTQSARVTASIHAYLMKKLMWKLEYIVESAARNQLHGFILNINASIRLRYTLKHQFSLPICLVFVYCISIALSIPYVIYWFNFWYKFISL